MRRFMCFFLVSVVFFVALYDWPFEKEAAPIVVNRKFEQKHEPYDQFYFQRSYPNKYLDFKSYGRAVEQVRFSDSRYKTGKANKGLMSDWKLEGPTNIGGRINCIEVHPSDSNTIYIGTAAGGIFKTTDGGQFWFPVGEGFSHLAISDISINPKNVNEVYAATGDHNVSGTPHIGNGVYKSTDGGSTWMHSGLSDAAIISRIVIDFNHPDTLYAASMGNPFLRNNQRGLYKSIDGGVTWNKSLFLSDQTGVIDLVIDPFNSNNLYCSGWDRIRNNSESLIFGNGARIWKTTDGGLNWTNSSTGLPNRKLSRIGLTISQKTPGLLFSVVVDTTLDIQMLYKTINGGTTWTELDTFGLDPGILGGFGWYFGKIRVSPYDDNQINLLGVDLYTTKNGGALWQQSPPDIWNSILHVDCHDLVYTGANTVLLATDGGLFKSSDSMLTWSDIDEIPNTQFYRIAIDPHNPGVYAGGAQDNGTVYGNASTLNSWTEEWWGDGFQKIYDPHNKNLVYFETQNGGLYYSQNGLTKYFDKGINSNDRRNWDMPFIMSSFNSGTLYTGTHRVYQIVSAPLSTWNPISPDLTDGNLYGRSFHNISALGESPTNALHLYAGTSDGNVWRSLSGGNSWVEITGVLPNRYVTAIEGSPNLSNTVYVTHSGYKDNDNVAHVHKSINNGNTWIDVSGDLPDLPINDIFVHPFGKDSILFVATDVGVYVTLNSGVNWSRLGGNMPAIPVFDIEFDPINRKLVAGTFARSMQSFPLDSIFNQVVVPSVNNREVAKHNLSIFPNPTLGESVTVVGAKEGQSWILINMVGREVSRGKLNTGDDQIEIHIKEGKGVYFLIVDGEQGPSSYKLIKH